MNLSKIDYTQIASALSGMDFDGTSIESLNSTFSEFLSLNRKSRIIDENGKLFVKEDTSFHKRNLPLLLTNNSVRLPVLSAIESILSQKGIIIWRNFPLDYKLELSKVSFQLEMLDYDSLYKFYVNSYNKQCYISYEP